MLIFIKNNFTEAVLFVFQFCVVCNFGVFINLGSGMIRSERFKSAMLCNNIMLKIHPGQ